jgi:hypothetical protein
LCNRSPHLAEPTECRESICRRRTIRFEPPKLTVSIANNPFDPTIDRGSLGAPRDHLPNRFTEFVRERSLSLPNLCTSGPISSTECLFRSNASLFEISNDLDG